MAETPRTFEGLHSTLILARPVRHFVRRFADLGDAMLIYTDGVAFDEALRSATSRAITANP